MAPSVGGLFVCCSVLFWVLLSPTTLQVTAAPFSNKVGTILQESHDDTSGASRNLDRDLIWHRRKKRFKNYPVPERPGRYNDNQFPGQSDYSRDQIGSRYPYDRSGYRGDNSNQEYAGGRDSRYEEFKKSQLWKQRRPSSDDFYNRPQKEIAHNRPIDTGSNTLYQPKRIGVPSHVAGFWGDSPNGAEPTLKEKSILQTLAKAERSRFHKVKPGSIKKVSTQYDFTDKAASNLPTNGKEDGRYPEEQGRYSSEYEQQKSREETYNQDVPYKGPQSQYRPPNELAGLSIRVNHPKIWGMLDQNGHGLKEGAPVDGMLLNLHKAPSLVPAPSIHKPETADKAAHKATQHQSAQQPASSKAALNATGTSMKEVEIPMPPKSKTWLEMHPIVTQGPSTTAAPTAAPTTTKLAIPMPPMSKVWLEEQRVDKEEKERLEEREEIERLEEVALRLAANQTSGTSGGGNSSRYISEVVEQPSVGKQAVVEDAGGAADDDRVYLTREEYARLQQQAQLASQRDAMGSEQREQETYLPAGSQVEEQDEPTNQVQGDPTNHVQGDPTNQVQGDPTNQIQGDPTNQVRDEPNNKVQENAHNEVFNRTVDGPESIKRDPTPEDMQQLRQAELERENQAMFEELEQEKAEISSEIQQSNETQTVNQLEEGSQGVTSNSTGSKNESLIQEELTKTRQSELEKEREQMLVELNEEEGELLGDDQSESKTEEKKEDEGLQSMAEAWEKMNSQKRRKKRSVPDQYSHLQVNNDGNSVKSDTEGEAGGALNEGVARSNDMIVDGHKIAMPAARGNSYKKNSGKYESFPKHEVKTDRKGVPKSVAGFWEDTKHDDDDDDDTAADKKPSSSLNHMKVKLNKANSPKKNPSRADNLPSKMQKLHESNFYKSKGIDRPEGQSTYKKTPFEDVGRLSPFKDNPKPETFKLPLKQKYPVPPVQSSLPIKANYETEEKVAPEKIVSFEKGVDDVPVPLKRHKVVIHNSVPRPVQHRPEYTSEQILAEKERISQKTLAEKVALARSHAFNHYKTDHAYVQENRLVKSPEKLVNESASSSNETDIAYQFFNTEFYNNVMARYKSKDAFWAALCLTIVLFVMFAAVWYSKMWRKKGGDWDLPGKYQPEATSIPIKELIRQKLGSFPRLKMKLKRKRKGPIGHRYMQLQRKLPAGATSSEEEVTYKRL